MADYTQVTFFAPKDELSTGNPSKLIKGSEVDPELAAIAEAIASKYDSNDVADTATAAALTSNTTLITPARLKYALENGVYAVNINGLTDLGAAAAVDDYVALYDTSGTVVRKVSVTNLVAGTGFVPNGRLITSGLGLDGGGDLSGDRTLNVLAGAGLTFSGDDLIVGQGSGISVLADSVAADRDNSDPLSATGYIDLPVSLISSDLTLPLNTRGKHVRHIGAGSHTFTVPPNSSIAFPVGSTVTISTDGSAGLSIAPGSGVTIVWAGVGSTGSRTLSTNSLATVTKVDTDGWFITGTGLS